MHTFGHLEWGAHQASRVLTAKTLDRPDGEVSQLTWAHAAAAVAAEARIAERIGDMLRKVATNANTWQTADRQMSLVPAELLNETASDKSDIELKKSELAQHR